MTDAPPVFTDDIAIVLSGEAGQGIQTIEFILARVLKRSGYHVFSTKEYMSRIRGGSNSIMIRASSRRVNAMVDRIDILVPLDSKALERLRHRISDKTVIMGDGTHLKTRIPFMDIPISAIAEEAGGRIYENTVAAGLLCGILEADHEVLTSTIRELFASKEAKVVGQNVKAVLRGYEEGRGLCRQGALSVKVDRTDGVGVEPLINGAEAVSFGAIAGGCNFVSSYPMSPSTAVLTNMAACDEQFGIVVEQAEDEIAAVNMAVGAWYAGARAMATTSGGGFALMEEAVSLAGMLETPLVIHLAQRPGPGTGLPTRTEQGDLELAIYSGHGEFPRIIYAPGTTEEAFFLTRRAFNEADRCQVPVFILTDQYFMDSYYNIPGLPLDRADNQKHIVKTEAGYRRYSITENGISPRGVPGFGEGLVTADSDEHDEEGHITEDMGTRKAMVDKRLGKMKAVLAHSVEPTLTGASDPELLVVSWGSTGPIVAEALRHLDRPDASHMHFSQVYPLPPGAAGQLKGAGRIAVVENNATGQFGRLLKIHADAHVDHPILKYNGLPFTVEEVAEAIGDLG